MKKLFLFTVNYPFSDGEHLLQHEVKFLLNHFDSLTIVCADTSSNQHFEVDKRISIIRNSFSLTLFDKLKSFLNVTSKIFWIENKFILFDLKQRLTISKIYSILLAIEKGKKSQKFIEQEVKIHQNDKHLYFYSWWTLTITNGFAFAKEKYPNLKIVTRARAVDLYFERHKENYIPLRKYLYTKLDRIFCISDDGKDYISKKFQSNNINKKVVISRVGCVNKHKYIESVENNLIKTIVTCSNIIALKRLPIVIEALSMLESKDINWVHFGDGELTSEIIALSKTKLQNKKNINFEFKGYISNNELIKYYQYNYVDLFLNVSEYEGIPVTIMEAMSFGIPIIATDVGGVKEIVNNDNGFLLSKELSGKLLCQTIEEFLCKDDKEKLKYRRNARKKWELDYNSENNFAELANEISLI